MSSPTELEKFRYRLGRLIRLGKGGPARGQEFYDRMYDSEQEYALDFRESMYLSLWARVYMFLRRIPGARVLEAGCGSGQFASFLARLGFRDYVRGFDLSGQAVQTARKRVDFDFVQSDATDPDAYAGDYNTIVSLETLEHIPDDFSALRHFPAGKFVVITLPDFEYESHYRWFTTPRQIERRYYRTLDIRRIVKIEKWFVVFGTVDPIVPGTLQRLFRTRAPVNGSFFWSRYIRPPFRAVFRPVIHAWFSR